MWIVGGIECGSFSREVCTVPGSGLRIALFKFRQSSPV